MVSVRQAPVVFPSRACCPLHLPQLLGTVGLAQASLDGGRMTAWNVLFPWVSRPGAGDPSTIRSVNLLELACRRFLTPACLAPGSTPLLANP